jgi:hypothetical protein
MATKLKPVVKDIYLPTVDDVEYGDDRSLGNWQPNKALLPDTFVEADELTESVEDAVDPATEVIDADLEENLEGPWEYTDDD